MSDDTKWWDKWNTEFKREKLKESFDVLDSFLTSAPKNILDIGCGLAYESEMFQKKYNSNLYLLDGDFEDTKNNQRDVGFGDASSMKFYNPISRLKESFDNRGMKYTFIDANNIEIPENVKFDLVYSNLSCGFHYPVNTYYNLLKTHTTDDSILIFDIKNSESVEDQFEIIERKSAYKGQKKIQKTRIKIKQ